MGKNEKYIRKPKEPGGSKWLSAQDEEDFEQELLIKEWLEREGQSGAIELKSINRKGTARNSWDQRCLSLDQQVGEDRSATLADFIAGSDGRDLECGSGESEPVGDSLESISRYLFALGFNQGDMEWLIKTLKLSIAENKLLLERSQIDLESLTQFEPFSR